MYKRLAAALGEQGMASLRIDFRGWGESAGQMAKSTIQGQLKMLQQLISTLLI